MNNLINELMKEEHKKILAVLDKCEKLVSQDFNSAKEEFTKFKCMLEKHLFIEEKAIFSISDSLINEEVSYIFDLLQEHGIIIELIKNIEKNLINNKIPNIRGFIIVLKRHADFEDSHFYPKLDEMLSFEERQEIIERIREIVRG